MSMTTITPSDVARRQNLSDFILLSAIWGASYLFMRLSATEFGALPTAGLRVGLAALFLTGPVLKRPVREALGIPHLIATEAALADGRYTGRTDGVLNMRDGKVQRLHAWLAGRGLDLWSISMQQDARLQAQGVVWGDSGLRLEVVEGAEQPEPWAARSGRLPPSRQR